MKTEMALLLQYDGPTMSIVEVAKLMGIGERTLENRIYAKECPIPMFKLGTKWAAHVADVADYIDRQREDAKKALKEAQAEQAI